MVKSSKAVKHERNSLTESEIPVLTGCTIVTNDERKIFTLVKVQSRPRKVQRLMESGQRGDEEEGGRKLPTRDEV